MILEDSFHAGLFKKRDPECRVSFYTYQSINLLSAASGRRAASIAF
jgi:hypothetical protein